MTNPGTLQGSVYQICIEDLLSDIISGVWATSIHLSCLATFDWFDKIPDINPIEKERFTLDYDFRGFRDHFSGPIVVVTRGHDIVKLLIS